MPALQYADIIIFANRVMSPGVWQRSVRDSDGSNAACLDVFGEFQKDTAEELFSLEHFCCIAFS